MKFEQIKELVSSLPTSKPVFLLSSLDGDIGFTLKEEITIGPLTSLTEFQKLLVTEANESLNKQTLTFTRSAEEATAKVLKGSVQEVVLKFIKKAFMEGLLAEKRAKKPEDTKLYKFYRVNMFKDIDSSNRSTIFESNKFSDLINVYDYMSKNVNIHNSSTFMRKDVHVMNTVALLNIIMDRTEPNFDPSTIRFRRRSRRRR